LGIFVFRYNVGRILNMDGAERSAKTRLGVIFLFLETSMMRAMLSVRRIVGPDYRRQMHDFIGLETDMALWQQL
jgi:hypothetical protein